MKRNFAILMLLTVCLSAQDWKQNNSDVWFLWNHPYWVFQEDSVAWAKTSEEYFLDIKAADTLYSWYYANGPGMTIEATVADSNAAADSVNLKIRLQWSMKDTSSWTAPQLLVWTDATGAERDSIITTGDFWAYVGRETYPAWHWVRAQVIAYTKHRILNPGVKIRLRAMSTKER